MSKFEDRLWMELVREHGPDLAQIRTPTRRARRRPRPRLLVGTTLGLAGIGTILALALGAASSSPAFAVTRNPDGTVTVRVTRFGGIAGANARLAALGVRAKAVQVTAGCRAARGSWVARRPKPQRVVARGRLQRLIVTARFDPKQIPAGHTLVLAAVRAGVAARVAPIHLIRGQPPTCFAVARPPLPPAVLRAAEGGHVHCAFDRPGFAARDGRRQVLPAPVVIKGTRVSGGKIRYRRIVIPKVARVNGNLAVPAPLAPRAARECSVAATSSRASRH